MEGMKKSLCRQERGLGDAGGPAGGPALRVHAHPLRGHPVQATEVAHEGLAQGEGRAAGVL